MNNQIKVGIYVILGLVFISNNIEVGHALDSTTEVRSANADKDEIKRRIDLFAEVSRNADTETLNALGIVTGEMRDLQFNKPLSVGTPDKIFLLPNGRAVAHVLIGPKNKDFYIFLIEKDSSWKIESLRALAQTALLERLVDEFEKLEKPPAYLEAAFQNAVLTLSSDKVLLEWFHENRSELQRLRTLDPKFSHHSEDKNAPIWRSNSAEANEIIDGLHINYATRDDRGFFEVCIGGILDNSVGFFHGKPEQVPNISALEYIWIEDVGNGWYFYKTT